jgi:hypothetical protein
MGASMAKTSWNRYNAAFHSWTNYVNFYGKLYSWPFDICLLRGCVNWAINVKHLQPNTVRIYLSDLKLAHCLRNAKQTFLTTFLLKNVERGGPPQNVQQNQKQDKTSNDFLNAKNIGS